MKLETSLIVGRGEVGNSLRAVLNKTYPVWCEDTRVELREMKDCPSMIDVLHICIRNGADFVDTAMAYVIKYAPRIVNVCSTVPVETMEMLEGIDKRFCHSTTRGLHPNLTEGLRTITKHVGGACSNELAEYLRKAGIPCNTHARAKTTALLHILNNVHYGVNLIFADEAAALCRKYGVDFLDYLDYTRTNNAGYERLGHPTKVRSILTAPGGKIGGHCVNHSASLIPEKNRPELFERVASYNED